MAKAGFCSQCGGNQWLNESGGCVAGHGPECISGVYEVGQGTVPAPVPVPADVAPAKKRPLWLIVVAVVALLALVGCGCLAAIAIPQFNAAKSQAVQKSCLANMRMVEGGAMVYVAEHEGATPPTEWNALMAELVPTILKTEPKCPAGGTYSWVPDSGSDASGHVECSIHGSINSPK